MMPSNQSAAAAAATETNPSHIPTRRVVKPTSRKPKVKTLRTTKTTVRPKQARQGSKKAKILALLKRPGGASLQQLQKATQWQAHSVRGFLSGALKKKMGLRVHSAKAANGARTYRVTSK